MAKSDAERKRAERQRRRESGLLPFEVWLYPHEWPRVKRFIERLRKRSGSLVILLALLLSACGGGGNDPPPVMIFIGDSITKYWNDPTWQTDEADLLSAHLPGVVDAGIGGQTCEQMQARFQHDVLDRNPAVVVIDCGTNDVALLQSADTHALFAMVKAAQAAGAQVIVGNLPPADFAIVYAGSWSLLDPLHAQWNTEIAKGAKTYGYHLANYYSAMSETDGSQKAGLFCSDGIHPTSAGYAVMWEVLNAQL